jgi:hypothetical protein
MKKAQAGLLAALVADPSLVIRAGAPRYHTLPPPPPRSPWEPWAAGGALAALALAGGLWARRRRARAIPDTAPDAGPR